MRWRLKHLVSVVAICIQITISFQPTTSRVNTIGKDGTVHVISSPAHRKDTVCQTNATSNNLLCNGVTKTFEDKHRTTYTNYLTKRFSSNARTYDLNYIVTNPFMYNGTTVSSIGETAKTYVDNRLPVDQDYTFIIEKLSQLCTYTDVCEQPRNTSSPILEPCCKPCSCKADCGGIDMCCFKNGTAEQNVVSAECLYIQPNLPGKTVSIYERYKIVKQCPPVLNTMHMVNASFDTFSPVFSTKTNVSYYNHYFASCNEDDNGTFLDWTRMAACPELKVSETYQRTVNDLLYGKCDLFFSPPAGFDLSDQKCYTVDISTCNSTGKWDIYDRHIETACNKLNFPYIPESRPPVVFANVFCFLCNYPKGVTVASLCSSLGGGSQWDVVDYGIILSYHENIAPPVVSTAPDPDSGCVGYKIFDTRKRRCVDVVCPLGMYRNEDGLCVHLIETIHKSRFKISLRLRKTTDNQFIDSRLNESEFLKLDNRVKEIFNSKHIIVCHTDKFIKITAAKAAKPVELLYTVDIKVKSYKASDLFKDTKQLLHGSVELVIHGKLINVSFDLFHSVLDDRFTVIPRFPNDIASTPKTLSKYKNLFDIDTVPHRECLIAFPRSVTKLAWCEQVVLEPEDYVPENTEDGSRVFLKASNRYLYHFILDLDRNVRICVTDYIETESFTDSKNSGLDSRMNNTTRIILIVTLFLEVAFLIFALIALWLLRVCRTVTGIQKVHLIFTLLLAKLPKVFVMIFGSADRLCSIVGILVHFFALSVQFITCMGCLFLSARFKRQQVFRVLALKSSKLAWHFIVTHGAASIFVGLNMFISIQTSKFQDFGYGTCKDISLIDDELRYILTFLVPNSAAVTVNGVQLVSYLFCKRQGEDRDLELVNNTGTIFVYFGLSFIVFLTWLCDYFRSNTTDILFYMFLVLSLFQSMLVGINFAIKTGQHLRLLPAIGSFDRQESYPS